MMQRAALFGQGTVAHWGVGACASAGFLIGVRLSVERSPEWPRTHYARAHPGHRQDLHAGPQSGPHRRRRSPALPMATVVERKSMPERPHMAGAWWAGTGLHLASKGNDVVLADWLDDGGMDAIAGAGIGGPT